VRNVATKATKATKKAKAPPRPAGTQKAAKGTKVASVAKATGATKGSKAKGAARTKSGRGAAPAKRRAPAPRRPTATKAKSARQAPAKKSSARSPSRTAETATRPRRPGGRQVRGASSAPAATARKATDGKRAPAKAKAPARPRGLDAAFLAEQRELLLAERATYVEQAQDLRAEADSLVQEMEPGDVQFDEESGEGGTVTVDRERDLALSAQALAAVEEIDRGLAKIEGGTYGVCESCQAPIPKARLKALPYAALCIACKSGGLSRR
jgi:RNA polymerase-binding transcription factor